MVSIKPSEYVGDHRMVSSLLLATHHSAESSWWNESLVTSPLARLMEECMSVMKSIAEHRVAMLPDTIATYRIIWLEGKAKSRCRSVASKTQSRGVVIHDIALRKLDETSAVSPG